MVLKMYGVKNLQSHIRSDVGLGVKWRVLEEVNRTGRVYMHDAHSCRGRVHDEVCGGGHADGGETCGSDVGDYRGEGGGVVGGDERSVLRSSIFLGLYSKISINI
ncbi:hypothetical protein QJS04_geneDACA021974 [Acorus gramineus]|uniref:Uncharacterized protein n=1 Tax=Acorus gramineus TaxID=55184 RepID=A0AAV9A9Z4_ACOGR|nr:hypothetical protein QJS04_geneDACA021974 [Acorus gramineus]